jgi:hypothetical protein
MVLDLLASASVLWMNYYWGSLCEEDILFSVSQSLLQEAESKSELSQNISAREHFVFTDNDGQVYHLTVEGNSVKDSARIPPDVSLTFD